MPHGGYHGVIKMGGRVIQDSSGRPVSSGGSSTPQRRQLKTASEIPDNRERFIANQAQKAANQQAQFLINQANRRSDVETAMRFAPETVNRSDFTGFTGGLLGLRTGDFQDTGIPKLREGLTSDQYANYMRGLYSINPQRMETMFPVASGKAIRNLSRFAPGLGTLQSIAGFIGGKTGDAMGFIGGQTGNALQGLKQIAINKGILPPTTLNPNTGTTVDPTKVQNVAELDPSTKALIAPDVYGGRSPIDEAFASLPSTQFGREYMQRFGPRVDLNTAPQQMSSSQFLIDQARKNFDAPVLGDEQMLADLNAGQRAVLDQRANRFAFDQGLATPEDMLNKIRPLDKSGIFGIGGNEANVQDIIDFYNDNPTVTMAEGGLASINNPSYNMLKNASDFAV